MGFSYRYDFVLTNYDNGPSWPCTTPTVTSPAQFMSGPVITENDVTCILKRASMATSSNDAIIAIVDRSGGILGVRTESDAEAMYPGREADLVFAIDGAVAKARTAAFFSNEEAPAPDALRADQFMVAGVRLPYQNFNRDPRG